MVAGKPELGTVVRVYQPGPTVAFSRKEETMPGFPDAVSEALAFGFEPVIRPAGGRMVALDQQWLVLDIVTKVLAVRLLPPGQPVSIVGDTVTWIWTGPDTQHSITGLSANAVRFDSDPGRTPDHKPGDRQASEP